MKKVLVLHFILLLIVSNLASQTMKGNGKLKTETVALTGFKHLVCQGNFSITLIQGEQEGVRISTDENLIELFQIRMEGEVLFITMLADIRKFEELKVYLSVRELQSITLLNQVQMESKQVLHFDDLSIFTSGTTQINCEFFATRLIMDLYDQCYASLKGYAEILSINAHDESELDAENLQSEKCKIISTGYSEVSVNCKKELKLKVTGLSNVYYTGEPKITERIFSSSGFIVKRKIGE